MTMDRNTSIEKNTLSGDYYADEISIVDLAMIVWRNRWAGILAASAVIILTALYLVFAKPVYESTVHFFPPLRQDVDALNVAQQHGLLGYSAGDVYGEFIKNLNSLELRWGFFQEKDLYDHYTQGESEANEGAVFNEAFNKKLIVKAPDKNRDYAYHALSFQFNDAEKTAGLLNEFVSMVIGSTKNRLIGNVKSNIGSEIHRLEMELVSKRNIIEQRREDTIARLQEALLIARKLKINKPADYSREYEVFSPNESVAVNTADKPLYIRGVLALEAEIEVLKNRKTDDPYISGLRDIQERMDALRGIDINADAVKIVSIDQPALVPDRPVKPKKLLVLVIGVFMAGFAGLMAAFVAEFVKNFYRQIKVNNKA